MHLHIVSILSAVAGGIFAAIGVGKSKVRIVLTEGSVSAGSLCRGSVLLGIESHSRREKTHLRAKYVPIRLDQAWGLGNFFHA